MKKNLLFILVLLLMMMTSCEDAFNEDMEPQFLDVQLSIQPIQAELNETIVFEAKVTYGDENVTDADDVKFEIWRAHDETHEVIPVEHTGDGIYRLEKSFSKEGTYYIFSHVTARSMHHMPKEEFVVGEPSEPEEGNNSQVMEFEEE